MTLWREDLFTKHLGWAPAQLRPYAGILCYALLRLPYTVSPAQTGVPAANRERLIEQLAAPLKEPQHPNWTDAIFSRDGRLCVDMAAIAYLNLFGTVKPDAATLKRYSTIDHIDGETPPAFLWTTATDEIVPASDTMDFAAGMYRNNRPVECHVFGSGEHGLSLAKTTTGYEHNHNPVGRWVAMACDWLSGLSETERGKKLPETEESLPRKKQTQKPEVPSQYYENIYQDRAGMFRHTPFALEQQLVGHVIQGDEPEALKTLGQINRQGDKAVLAANPLRSARNSIICSCTFLARAVIQAGVPVEEAFALSDSVIQHLETLREQKAVIEYEADMLVQFIRMVQKTQNKNYTVPIRKAMHYVDANLDKPLKLNDVASYAKVHPNYLSNRFRLETGNTLSGYVADRKIHEASYFVQHTDYSMAEIATLYGFSSQSYFIASFKKVMGVPPGEYRSRAGRIQ
jgi:AraC-like DNA-binding protein